MRDRTTVATTSLHISAVLYVLAGLALLINSSSEDPRALPVEVESVGCILVLVLAAGVEAVARGLRRRSYWAWVAGLCIFILYIPTVFLPLGALGLWALLSPATRQPFGVGPLSSAARPRRSTKAGGVIIRLLLLTIVLTGAAIAYVRFMGVGMPPYGAAPEPSEQDRVHRLVGLALFAVAALSGLALASVAVYLARIRRRAA
jgi:hypothetical protein